jgi:hypothetical protein
MRSLHVLTCGAAALALGGVTGFYAALVQMPRVVPPSPIVHRIYVHPAGLQISCADHDVQEFQRVCRARKRMERVGP